ncbi:MAG: hypothetical protein IPG71_02570 [bacterium]|nr:hypothetical protein [bacterium]
MSSFELWWIIAIFPFYSLIAALFQSWHALLHAGSDDERKAIIDRAAIRALFNMIIVGGVVAAPWPYKAAFFVPTIVSGIGWMSELVRSRRHREDIEYGAGAATGRRRTLRVGRR